MNASRTARERARAELTREITATARSHLATHGAAGLSLRAVARDLDMVSSAIHRYFPSKDDLLTALIVEGYDVLGTAVEDAEAECPRSHYRSRWLTVCRAVRAWALDHRHEYALIYGSPVPGYAAPQETIAPAGRAVAAAGRVVAEAHAQKALRTPEGFPVPSTEFAPDAERMRAIVPGVPDETAARLATAWTGVFGWVSFELFGQFANVVLQRENAFEHHAACLAHLVGVVDVEAGELG